MFVHSARIELRLPSRSLKGKRGIVKSILARSRNLFNVSSAEVDLQDVYGRAVLGFVTVTESRSAGRQTMERIEDWIAEERPDVEIVEVELEER
jgi:uncharacterized protein YlxP (DUF503 family)